MAGHQRPGDRPKRPPGETFAVRVAPRCVRLHSALIVPRRHKIDNPLLIRRNDADVNAFETLILLIFNSHFNPVA
jgi:hypothetical protein